MQKVRYRQNLNVNIGSIIWRNEGLVKNQKNKKREYDNFLSPVRFDSLIWFFYLFDLIFFLNIFLFVLRYRSSRDDLWAECYRSQRSTYERAIRLSRSTRISNWDRWCRPRTINGMSGQTGWLNYKRFQSGSCQIIRFLYFSLITSFTRQCSWAMEKNWTKPVVISLTKYLLK